MVRVVMMKLVRWDDRREVMNQEEACSCKPMCFQFPLGRADSTQPRAAAAMQSRMQTAACK